MRLWHYKLIPVLPKEMLVSQWRECIAIKRQWEKGSLKHRLVSYVKNHSKKLFFIYVHSVCLEMDNRGIKYQEKFYNEIKEFCIKTNEYIPIEHYPEHNYRYLTQCLCNLQEKYDRGIVSKEEWDKIEKAEIYLYAEGGYTHE